MLRAIGGVLLLVMVSTGIGAILSSAILQSGLSVKDIPNPFVVKPAVFQVDADAEGRMIGLAEPSGAKFERVPATSGGMAAARLSGMQPNASPGGAPGIFVRLPDDFERAASGQMVRVTVMARRAPEAPSPSFAVSYSTADVGNSGWKAFSLTDQPAGYSFTYAVPQMKKGYGDFIGILPDTTGSNGAVDVSRIFAEVVVPDQKAAVAASSPVPASP